MTPNSRVRALRSIRAGLKPDPSSLMPALAMGRVSISSSVGASRLEELGLDDISSTEADALRREMTSTKPRSAKRKPVGKPITKPKR